MDGVIIGSAARMSQYVNESCFKYRNHGKNRIDRYRRWKRNITPLLGPRIPDL